MSRITKTRSRRKTALWRLLAAVLVLALAWLCLGTSLSLARPSVGQKGCAAWRRPICYAKRASPE